MFKGSIVAIITPFTENGIDEQKLRDLVNFQIEGGTSGILPCGTTGESPTLTHTEHDKVIEIVVNEAAGRVPVIAGTGSNSTAEAIALTKHAEKAGADGALVVTPYYNKPTQKGLYLHFKAIADSVKIPIILYNIEGRAARNIDTDTVVKLYNDCKNIIGVKEASGSIEQARAVKEACGDDFLLLSGDDALTLDMMEFGGEGVISVVANLVPHVVATMIKAFNDGDKEEAYKIKKELEPLVAAMFIETNPIPVKHAAELLGLCSGRVRLPLCEMEEMNELKLVSALESYGLLVTKD